MIVPPLQGWSWRWIYPGFRCAAPWAIVWAAALRLDWVRFVGDWRAKLSWAARKRGGERSRMAPNTDGLARTVEKSLSRKSMLRGKAVVFHELGCAGRDRTLPGAAPFQQVPAHRHSVEKPCSKKSVLAETVLVFHELGCAGRARSFTFAAPIRFAPAHRHSLADTELRGYRPNVARNGGTARQEAYATSSRGPARTRKGD